jgi:hypothetical protein
MVGTEQSVKGADHEFEGVRLWSRSIGHSHEKIEVVEGELHREHRQEVVDGEDVVLEAHPDGWRGAARRGGRDHRFVNVTAQAVRGRVGSGERPGAAHVGEGDLTRLQRVNGLLGYSPVLRTSLTCAFFRRLPDRASRCSGKSMLEMKTTSG